MNQSIYLSAGLVVLGPFTTPSRPLVAGETLAALTAAQYTALDALRKANPGTPLAFDGAAFAIAPGEVIRRALMAVLAAQAPGVQSFFGHVAGDVKTLLQSGQIAQAKALIQTVPLFGDATLVAAQTQMLAAFPA